MTRSGYAFRPLTRADLVLVDSWLREPHVARWWGDPEGQIDLIVGDLDEPRMTLNLAELDGAPFAYIQSYRPNDWGHIPRQPEGTHGIDQFIGPPDMVGKGHGPGFMAAYCARLFAEGASRVIVDPDPENAVAIRAYEKAGFRRDGLIETKDGPAMLMVRDRA